MHEIRYMCDGKILGISVQDNGRVVHAEGGVPDGPVIGRFDNGNISDIALYRNGKYNGLALTFYPDQSVRVQAHYVDGYPEGLSTTYYQNGNVMAESEIHKKNPTFSKEYYENGRLKEEVYYEGDVIRRRSYDINGDEVAP